MTSVWFIIKILFKSGQEEVIVFIYVTVELCSSVLIISYKFIIHQWMLCVKYYLTINRI